MKMTNVQIPVGYPVEQVAVTSDGKVHVTYREAVDVHGFTLDGEVVHRCGNPIRVLTIHAGTIPTSDSASVTSRRSGPKR